MFVPKTQNTRYSLVRTVIAVMVAVGVIVVVAGVGRSSSVQAAGRERVYLPLLNNAVPTCAMQGIEQELFDLIATHPEQRRPFVECDPRILAFARMRARYMVAHPDQFSHTNPDGRGPNQLLRETGYPLNEPAWWYSPGVADANTVEALVINTTSAQDAFTAFMRSPGHRGQLLGTRGLTFEQTTMAVGCAINNPGSIFETSYDCAVIHVHPAAPFPLQR